MAFLLDFTKSDKSSNPLNLENSTSLEDLPDEILFHIASFDFEVYRILSYACPKFGRLMLNPKFQRSIKRNFLRISKIDDISDGHIIYKVYPNGNGRRFDYDANGKLHQIWNIKNGQKEGRSFIFDDNLKIIRKFRLDKDGLYTGDYIVYDREKNTFTVTNTKNVIRNHNIKRSIKIICFGFTCLFLFYCLFKEN